MYVTHIFSQNVKLLSSAAPCTMSNAFSIISVTGRILEEGKSQKILHYTAEVADNYKLRSIDVCDQL